jgi:hypothetical protein
LYVPGLKTEIMFQEEGTISYLAAKFQFKIVSSSEWDLSVLEGKKCIILQTNSGIKFLSIEH